METFPLLKSQMGVFVDCVKYPASTQYNIPSITELTDAVDPDRLERAVRQIYRCRRELHIRFRMNDQGDPVQYIPSEDSFQVVRRKMERSKAISYAEHEFVRPFDLFGKEPLFRAEIIETEEKNYLLIDYHHILMDGISTIELFTKRDMKKAYEGTLAPAGYGMLEYALEQNRNPQPDAYQRDRAYFLNRFEGLSLATLSEGQGDPVGKLLRASSFVPCGEVDAFSRKYNLPVDGLFQAAFSRVLISFMTGKKAAYTMMIGGRHDRRLQNSYGMFVETIPALAELNRDTTVVEMIRSCVLEKMMAIRHHSYPFTDFCEELHTVPGISFNFISTDHAGEYFYFGEEECPIRQIEPEKSMSDIAVSIYRNHSDYEIRVTSSEKLNSQRTLAAFGGAIRHVLYQMMRNPEAPAAGIPVLTEEETQKICSLSAGEPCRFEDGKTFVDLFLEAALAHPQSPAVTDSSGSLTYQELNRLSDSVAAWLLAEKSSQDVFAAVRMGRVKEFAAAVLGVMKAGMAYVPVDGSYPEGRIRYMLEDSGARLVLTEAAFAEIVKRCAGAEPVNLARPGGYAYMIYTSGSTGRPKGVVQSHRSLRHFAGWRTDRLAICHGKNYGHFNSFSFDGSLDDLICPLAAGACVHIFHEEDRLNIRELADYIIRKRINGLTVPTRFGMELIRQNPDLPLDYLMMGGEALQPAGTPGFQVINGYGPTEFTVCSSYYIVRGDEKSIPIGRPVPGTASYICDSFGHLLPAGIRGELCLAGPQIAEGYWKQESLMEEKFVRSSLLQGGRIYRTGDLARYNEDGNLEYLGRMDSQLKLRGFRIETGEIEYQASLYEGIQSAAVSVFQDQLVLYYTVEHEIDRSDLRAYLAERLTEYMLPAFFVQLPQMPLSPSGKIDRKALPQPVITGAGVYEAPRDEAERTVAGAVQELLGITEPAGALDSFFALGGDSIKAIRLVSMLRDRGMELGVSDIMKGRTVREIARLAKHASAPEISHEPYEGPIPDTPIIAFFKDLHLPEPAYFHQSRLLVLKERAEIGRLQRAWDACVARHDMLRAVYDSEKETLFVRESRTKLIIEEARVDADAALTAFCLQVKSHLVMDEALVRAVLIHGEEKDYFLIVAHHLVVDGLSWQILLEDLRNAWEQSGTEEEIRLASGTSSYFDYARVLKEYRDSYRLSREIPYWRRTEEKLRSLPLSRAKDYNRNFDRISLSMDEEKSGELVHADFEKWHADINDLLLTAVCSSYARATGHISVSVQMEGHGRQEFAENLRLDRTVGWFTSVYPVVIEDLSGQIEKDFVTVKESLHRVPDKGAGYSVLRYLAGKKEAGLSSENAARIGFNYLGDLTRKRDDDWIEDIILAGDGRIDTGYDVSPANVFGPDLSVNCLVEDGCFKLQLDYNTDIYEEDTAIEFVRGIPEEIRALCRLMRESAHVPVTATDLGETEWTDREFLAVSEDFQARGVKLERIYPLLPMQESMLFTHISEPESSAYRLVHIFEMEGLPTAAQLQRAVNRLVRKHEVLRTAIIYDGVSVPRQAITDRVPVPVMADVSGEADPFAAAMRLREEMIRDGFDLKTKPLFNLCCARKDTRSCYLIVAVHHIIIDGWCIRLYLSDLAMFLRQEMEGVSADETAPSAQGGYETAVREILSKDMFEGLSYWRALLEDYENKAEIPSYGEVPEELRCEESDLSITLDQELTDRFTAVCRQAGATVSNGIELAWGLVLQTYCNCEDVVFAKVVSGRGNTKVDVSRMVGLFINSVPVRVKTEKETTAFTALAELRRQADESGAYDFCPLERIEQQTELGSNLLQTVLTFENYDTDGGPSADALKPVYTKEELFDSIIPSLYLHEGELVLNIAFDRRLYRREEITRVLRLFKTLVEGMAAQPDRPLCRLDRLNSEDRADVLALSGGEKLAYDAKETWLDLFARTVDARPGALAVKDASGQCSYARLDEESDRIAAWLIAQGVQKNDPVIVKMDRVKEFVITVVGIHKAGAAYVPVDPAYPEKRIRYMLEDSDARMVLTEEKVKEILAKTRGQAHGRINLAEPDCLAYMIYTSGSTGKPKGVSITQRSLLNYVYAVKKHRKVTGEDRISHHVSFSFDGHIEDLYPQLAVGAALFIMPETIRREPDDIYAFLERNRITGGSFTTTIGKMLVSDYDLHMRFISLGGEALTDIQAGHPYTITNAYGPTECTDIIALYDLDPNRDYSRIPIGRPMANGYIFIIDRNGNLLPRGVAGEICYAGPQAGVGYRKLPEKTAQSFEKCPFVEGLRMYHTGDLGRYNEEGQVECLGRADNQIKLRGYRIELGEIEACAAHYEGVRLAAAAVQNDRLILYYCTEDGSTVDEAALKAFMEETLASYMIPAVFVHLSEMPFTPSGKINRRALPAASGRDEEITRPRTKLEEQLIAIAKKNLDIGEFGVTDDLVSLGMSSIMLMHFAAEIKAGLGRSITVRKLMQTPSISRIAEILENEEKTPVFHLTQAAAAGTGKCCPITENQRGIYLAWEKNRESTSYNIPYLYECKNMDAERLVRAVKTVLDNHPYLNTRFGYKDGDLVQMLQDEETSVAYTVLDKEPEIGFFQEKVRPFNLLEGGLCRFEVISFENRTWLFSDIHHIICDGLTYDLLLQNILTAYDGGEISRETVTACDYAQYEKDYRNSDRFSEDEAWFGELVAGAETAVYPDSAVPDGRPFGYCVSRIDAQGIDRFCQEHHVTPAGFMQAAVAEVLKRITRQEKMLFATISNGRSADPELLNAAGMFVKTLPAVVKGEEDGDRPAADYVREIYQQLQETIAREDYPYTRLVEEHRIQAEIFFGFQDGVQNASDADDRLKSIPLFLDAAKFPVSITISPAEDSYVITLEYDGTRYGRTDMETLASAIGQTALSLVTAEKMKDVSMLNGEEEEKILALSRGEALVYDTSKTWVDLFREHARRNPDKTAVVDSTSRMSYGELDRISDSLAAWLLKEGIEKDSFVAIKMGRVKEFVAAVLGIQKAGAAYVPIDPDYPEQRIRYMLDNSDAKFVITRDRLGKIRERCKDAPPVNRAKADGIAYMIYTSGSTGLPKGTVLRHSAVRALVEWGIKCYGITSESVHAHHPSFSFDASVNDIVWALSAGAELHILSEAVRRDLDAMAAYLKENKVSGMTFSTQIGMALVNRHPELKLDFILMGGEKMVPCEKTEIRLMNGYGPTEFAVCSSYHEVDQSKDINIPIGRSVPGTCSFICDTYGRLLPQGMAGELCLSGPQMADGYWKQPALTKEKFTAISAAGQIFKVYRTGDLAHYNPDGELEFHGRIDNQIKLRGYRVEPGEIENCAVRYPGVRLAAVMEKNGQIVLYYQPEDGAAVDKAALKQYLAQRLTDYMVPSVLMGMDRLPLNENGKINRKALPDPLAETLEMLPPQTELERELFAIACSVLNTDHFGVTDDLVGLGLSSIGMMNFMAEIHSRLGRTVEMSQIMHNPVIRELAKMMEAQDRENVQRHVITPCPGRAFYPITENQRGVYLDWERNRDSLQYNVPSLYLMKKSGEASSASGGRKEAAAEDAKRLARAVSTVINAHAYLKTRFSYEQGVLVQRLVKEEAQVRCTILETEPELSWFQEKVRPFDLLHDRLYRAEVVVSGEKIWLFLDIHHIIYDGLSGGLLLRDILHVYEGGEPTEEQITALDYAVYEDQYSDTERYREDGKYFESLVGDAQAVSLPTSSYAGSGKNELVSASVDAQEIDVFCRTRRVTVASFLNAALAETLSRITRQEKLLYATINNGRSADSRLLNAMGMFVRTLPVVHIPSENADMTTEEYVKAMHGQLQQTMAREMYPYTRLVDDYRIYPDLLFVYQGGLFEMGDIEGMVQLPLELDTVKFPVSVTAYPDRGSYVFRIEYDGRRFDRADMESLGKALGQMALSMAEHERLSDAGLVGEKDREAVLKLSAGKKLNYDRSKTWLDLFAGAAAAYPERIAVTDYISHINYRDLDIQSDHLAKWLVKQGVRQDEPVIVRMDRIKEFVVAVIGIHKAGAAYLPVDPAYPEKRIRYMTEDSGAGLILTEEVVRAALREFRDDSTPPVNFAKPGNMAYMIYTSGSTGKPKGACLNHAGLLNYTFAMKDYMNFTEEDRVSHHVSFSFDGHIKSLFPVLAAGAGIFIMPEKIRREPDEINEFLLRHRITNADFTTAVGKTLYNCFDLKLRNIVIGGEMLTDVVSSRDCAVVNCYGPTECTDIIALYRLEPGRVYKRIPVGRPMPNGYIFILDPRGHLVPPGITGEICYAGPQTGREYWNNPEKTKEVFEECPFVDGVRMYHTGDLGRYNKEGCLECLGRIDNQIKLRGYRVELGEIESCASHYEGIRMAAAAVKKDRLILYYCLNEENGSIDEEALGAYMAETLPSYMMPSVFVHLPAMPFTPSGKIDRKALRDPVSGGSAAAGPETKLEEELLALAEKNLKLGQFGVTDDLVGLGMSSIGLMRFAAQIRESLGKSITVRELMAASSIREIAAVLEEGAGRGPAAGSVVKAAPVQDAYPITENQRGVYLDWENNRESLQYNTPSLLDMGDVDGERLAEAVRTVVDNHPYLKTRFAFRDGELVQERNEEEAYVSCTRVDEKPEISWFQTRVRPFDLLSERLYRIEVIAAPNTCWLFMDVHHIIFDGLSTEVVMKEIFAVLGGETPAPEKVSAYDYALYEQEYLASPACREANAYFDDLLAGSEAAVLRHSKEPDGRSLASVVSHTDLAEIDSFCRRNDLTAASFMQAAFAETLGRLNRQDNIFYVTVSNGRQTDPALLGTVGMFARTLPVVVKAKEAPAATVDYVRQMQSQLRETTGREMYPYTRIVSELGERAGIIFVYQGGMFEGGTADVPGQIALELDTPKFDIAVTVYPEQDQYRIHLEYDGRKYNQEDMQLFADALANAASSLAKKELMEDVSLLSTQEEEKMALLSAGDPVSYEEGETWVDLFVKAAAEYPEYRAVVDEAGSLSYRELDRKSDAVASCLIEAGVRPRSFVAVEIGRNRAFVIAVIGIMKAGAAYLPLDPAYPQDRRQFMLSDSGAGITLTEETLETMMKKGENSGPVNLAESGGYAYMIYTSGSTGTPKGVVQSHRSLHHFVSWRTDRLGITAGGNYGHLSSFAFDASLDDLTCPLAVGATVHIFGEEMRKDLLSVEEYIRREMINGMTVPTLLGMELAAHAPELPMDYLMMGGEKLAPCRKTSYRIINGYGPTEFTVCSSFYTLRGDEQEIPIGRPVPGTASYICDTRGRLLPAGMTGELCLAGPQMAEGYWNQPELTKENFTTIRAAGRTVPVYHTGDMAAYTKDGQLMYAGRADAQIKLRGFRIELSEIEACALRYVGVAQAAADVRNDQIVLYYTVDESRTEESDPTRLEGKLRSFMERILADYMVPSWFVQMEKIPVTVNGKADRKRLPDPVIAQEENYVEPSTEYEIIVAKCMKEVLKLTRMVGAADSFAALGGDSINTLRMVSSLYQYGIRVHTADILKYDTVRNIAAHIEEQQTALSISQDPMEGPVGESAIMSFFRYLELPREEAFTQQLLLKLNENTEHRILEDALGALAWQHDLLRAVYDDGQLVVKPAGAKIRLKEVFLEASDKERLPQLLKDLRRQMDMRAALFCPVLIHRGNEELLYLLAHHLIVDGVSWRILTGDLEDAVRQLQKGKKPVLEPKTSTYRDYVNALHEYRNSPALAEEIPFWNGVMKKLLALPASDTKDYSRSFASVSADLNRDGTGEVLGARRTRLHLNMNDLLITALARAWRRITGSGDVSIQLEGHGRENFGENLQIERTVGWFTSVYPVVLDGISAGSGREIEKDLIRVKETLHRVPAKGAGYNILRFVPGQSKTDYLSDRMAKISFNYLGEAGSAEESGSLFSIVPQEEKASRGERENGFGSDININCMILNGCFHLDLDYNESLYRRDEMEQLAQNILAEMRKETSFLNSLHGDLMTASDYGETAWTVEKFEQVRDSLAAAGEKILSIRALTEEEEAQLSAPDSASDRSDAAYAYVGVFETGMLPEKEDLEKALEQLAGSNEIFRTSYVHEGVSVPRMVFTDRRLHARFVRCGENEDARHAARKLRDKLLSAKAGTAADPLFDLYVVSDEDSSCCLVMAMHQAVLTCTGVSGFLLAIKLITNIAYVTDKSFSVTDLICPADPLRRPRVDRQGVKVCEFCNAYEEEKPTIVVVLGIVLQMSVQHLLDDWRRRFNVLLIEDVNYHYNELFKGERYPYIVHFYAELIECILPKKNKVFGYIGYSFGGELGYSLTAKMDRIRNNRPIAFLGDSDLIPSQGAGFAKTYTREDFGEMLLAKFRENDIPEETMLFAYSMLSFLNAEDKIFDPYEGRTVLLRANLNNTPEQLQTREMLARQHARDLRVIDYPDRDHFNLHNNPDMLPVYDELFTELMSEEGKATEDE